MMIKDCALLFKGFLLFLKSHILENVLSKTDQVLGLILQPSLSIQDSQISNFCLSSSRRLPKALLVSMHQVLCLRPSDSQPLILSTESANPPREKKSCRILSHNPEIPLFGEMGILDLQSWMP